MLSDGFLFHIKDLVYLLRLFAICYLYLGLFAWFICLGDQVHG